MPPLPQSASPRASYGGAAVVFNALGRQRQVGLSELQAILVYIYGEFQASQADM